MNLQHREDIAVWIPLDSEYELGELQDAVEQDGTEYTEVTVWNFLNVDVPYQFSGGNPTVETYTDLIQIETGGGGRTPRFITTWVAETLFDELHLDSETLEKTFNIQVVDLEADEIHPL